MWSRILVQIGRQMDDKIETKSASERMQKMHWKNADGIFVLAKVNKVVISEWEYLLRIDHCDVC